MNSLIFRISPSQKMVPSTTLDPEKTFAFGRAKVKAEEDIEIETGLRGSESERK